MRLLNKSELAEKMGVSRPTVDGWIRRGAPAVQRGGKNGGWQFDLEAVELWYTNYHRQCKSTTFIKNPLRMVHDLTLGEFFKRQGRFIETGIGLVAERNKLSRQIVEQIFFDLYMLATGHFQKWIQDDCIDAFFTETTGSGIDVMFNLPHQKGADFSDIFNLDSVPGIIRKFYNKDGSLKAQ